MKKNILYLLLVVPALAFVACQDDDTNVFGEKSSLRMQKTLETAKTLLCSSDNGWVLSYYPHRELSYGGIAYTIKFSETEAEVGCAYMPDSTYTSYYKLTNDNGPMLSFDTYNPILHYFATPNSEEYEAKDGDFEFAIDSIGTDMIRLYGKRTHNIMYLRKLDVDAASYRKAAFDNRDCFFAGFRGTIGDDNVVGKFDLDGGRLYVGHGDVDNMTDTITSATTSFMFTDNGIELYKAITVGGVSFQKMTADRDNNTFALTAADGKQTVVDAVKLPDTYVRYSEIAGDYTLTYNQNTLDVTLSDSLMASSFSMGGINPNYRFNLGYDRNEGRLTWTYQYLGYYTSDNGTYFPVYLFSWDAAEGFLGQSEREGFNLVRDVSSPKLSFTFQLMETATRNYNSFYILYLYQNADGEYDVDAPPASWGWSFNGGESRFPYLQSLTKK